MEQVQTRRMSIGFIAQVKKRYQQLKNRYGPRYTYAMVSAAFFTLFVPIPGLSLVSVALVVAIAEVHRTISNTTDFPATIAKEFAMPIHCDVILNPSATPSELAALGTALWRWCSRTAADNRIYQFLDNQSLADLIAGHFPAPSQGHPPGVHFMARDEVSLNRQAAITSLRREMPALGIDDILVAGTSWNFLDERAKSHG